MRRYKYALVLDPNDRWYVRRVASTVHDLDKDVVLYTCDKPIANDETFSRAIKALNKAIRKRS